MIESEPKDAHDEGIERGPPKQQRGAATSEGILRTALRLMAENGYNGVSIRRICAEAGVNLALMNYHFGTKARLLLAIFQRSATAVNRKRMHMLDELEKKFDGCAPPVEEVLRAFIIPTVDASRDEHEDDLHFLRLSGRLATDPTPEVRAVISEVYDTSVVRCVQSLRRSCAHIPTEEFFMRLVFLYGAMLYARAEIGRVDALAGKLGVDLPRRSVEDTCKYLIPFLAAAFRAPPSGRNLPTTTPED